MCLDDLMARGPQAQADPEQQKAFVDWYDALMTVRHDGAKRRI